VKYSLKEGIEAISCEWFYQNVIPSIRKRFEYDNKLCDVLGLALLYACFTSGETEILVPDVIKKRVHMAYEQLGIEEAQPVRKIPLIVQRRNDQMVIDEYIEVGNHQVMNGQINGAVMNIEYFQSILVCLNQLEQLVNNHAARSDANIADMRSYINQKMRVLNNNI